LREKYATYDRFKEISGFWIGADFLARTRWRWRDHPQAFKGIQKLQ